MQFFNIHTKPSLVFRLGNVSFLFWHQIFIEGLPFIAVNTFHQEGDKVLIGNRSCNYPAQLEKDTELAHAYVGGFIFEKVDAGKTKVINISDMDPKGSIPGFVKNAIASKRSEVLATLEQKIKDYKGWTHDQIS